MIMLPDGVVQVNNLDEMVAAIYGSPIDPELFQDRAILAPKNVDVDRTNTLIMDKFEGEERIYTSIDSVEDDSQNNYPMEFLNSLRLNDTPPHRLMRLRYSMSKSWSTRRGSKITSPKNAQNEGRTPPITPHRRRMR